MLSFSQFVPGWGLRGDGGSPGPTRDYGASFGRAVAARVATGALRGEGQLGRGGWCEWWEIGGVRGPAGWPQLTSGLGGPGEHLDLPECWGAAVGPEQMRARLLVSYSVSSAAG